MDHKEIYLRIVKILFGLFLFSCKTFAGILKEIVEFIQFKFKNFFYCIEDMENGREEDVNEALTCSIEYFTT